MLDPSGKSTGSKRESASAVFQKQEKEDSAKQFRFPKGVLV